MTFLHPTLAMAALGAVSLPIIIHFLFRRRRVPVDWAAMELLREAVRRTNRRLRLEQWLLLALRCLAVLAAGLAIAVPLADRALIDSIASRTWIVVIDNGATSALKTGSSDELGRLRDEVRQAITARGPSDRIGIVTAAGQPTLVLTPTNDAQAIEQAIARLESRQTPSDLKGAIELANTAFIVGVEGGSDDGRDEARRILIASGFRRASLTEGLVLGVRSTNDSETPDVNSTSVEYLAVAPATDAPTDVRIDRIEARPMPNGGSISVRAIVLRDGANLFAAETRARATCDGFSTPPPRTIRWESGQSEAVVEFQLATTEVLDDARSRRRGVVVALDDDTLAVGNSAYAIVDVRREIEVGIIGRRGSLDGADLEKVPASLWISRAIAPGSGLSGGLRVRDIDPSTCDSRALLGLDAVVVARPDLFSQSAGDALGLFLRNGGVVILLPAGESLAQAWGGSLLPRLGISARIGTEASVVETPLRLAEEQPQSMLLDAVRPELAALVAPIEVTRILSIDEVASGEVVLAFADGSPFVAAQAPKSIDGTDQRGLAVIFASTPELPWTNLPVKPLMVPLFQELIRAGLQFAAGRDEVAVGERMRGSVSAVFRNTDGESVITGIDGLSTEIISKAGIWRADDGNAVAANVRAPTIALSPTSIESLRSVFAPVGGVRVASSDNDENLQVAQRSATDEMSFVLLVVALVTLLIEGVLSRVFSHASVRRAGRSDIGISTVGRVRARPLGRLREEAVGTGGGA